jgi:signal transduction histidine kinase
MRIRRHDVLQVCDSLRPLCEPFGVYGIDGQPLYETDGFACDSATPRLDLFRDEAGTGAVVLRGSHPRLPEAAALLTIFLTQLKEKKALSGHALAKYKELSLIGEISEILSTSAELDDVLLSIAARCKTALRASSCSIMTAEEESGTFFLRVTDGRVVNDRSWMSTSEGIAGRVYRTGKALIVNDMRNHPDQARGGDWELKSLICMPLRTKDRIIGVINVSNRRGDLFTSEDESLMVAISAMVAGAIESWRLVEEKIKNEKFAALGQMAAGIIHDIKNPMATIKGFAGLLADLDFSKEERKQYGGMIVSEVDRLVAMVEDLLAFTRGFRSTMSPEATQLGSYLTEVAAYLEADFAARGIVVEADIRTPCVILLDRERFKRVIFNLTGNAREAMHDGGRLLILARPAEGEAEIVFSDTGPGIPEDILGSLFDPFVTRGKKSGTGLGLAVSKKIVEELGGTIRALNGRYSGVDDFNGANIIIRLPLATGPA